MFFRILESMKQLSEHFRDRPLPPLQSAVYWTEYVLRHQGAPHLRPASTSLPFYQLWLLDIIAVLLIILAISAPFIVKFVYIIIRKKDSKKEDLKKEN